MSNLPVAIVKKDSHLVKEDVMKKFKLILVIASLAICGFTSLSLAADKEPMDFPDFCRRFLTSKL
jgi:hypothetical protein